MARYYRHRCSHTSLYKPWKSGPDVPCGDLCSACKEARIGEIIEFARHGKAPASGISHNARDRTAEAGVSVYEIVKGEIQYCGWWFSIAERPLYRGKGEVVGWGSDGEPLVSIIECGRVEARP